MKRICYYSILTELGGAEKSLLDLVTRIESLSQGRYSPLVLLPKNQGSLVDELRKNRIPYEVIAMPESFLKTSRSSPVASFILILRCFPQLLIYWIQWIHWVRSSRSAVLHTTGIKCHLIAAASKPFSPTPVLCHLRDIFRRGPLRFFLNLFGKIPGVTFVANSRSTGVSLRGSPQVPLIYNGLDEKIYYPEPHPTLYRRVFGVGSSIPIIGILGVLARWKGQPEFIQMAKRLVENGVDARFVILGNRIYDTALDQGYELELKKLVKELHLENHVYFAGRVDHPEQALNGLDLLVHASIKPEPFGRVILEAMACGVPIVAANAGGVPELVENRVNGLLFEPAHVGEMAKQAELLLRDSDLRQTCIKNGLDRFKKDFTIEAHVKKVIEIYDKISSRNS